jgi:hypothetical protein
MLCALASLSSRLMRNSPRRFFASCGSSSRSASISDSYASACSFSNLLRSARISDRSINRDLSRNAEDHVAVAIGWASGAIVPVPCGEETLDMIEHEAVVIGLGEGGSLLANVSSLFGGCHDCSGKNNLSVGQMGSHPTR